MQLRLQTLGGQLREKGNRVRSKGEAAAASNHESTDRPLRVALIPVRPGHRATDRTLRQSLRRVGQSHAMPAPISAPNLPPFPHQLAAQPVDEPSAGEITIEHLADCPRADFPDLFDAAATARAARDDLAAPYARIAVRQDLARLFTEREAWLSAISPFAAQQGFTPLS